MLLAGLAAGLGVRASAEPATDLTTLSLEDLLTSEVTSVAKRPQTVQNSPAATFVINREDIRRSGASDIPDLLRMVPGMEVADLAGGAASVSARGFGGLVANKLLVLVDGRAVYNSILPGVPWDQQLTPLEEIERIEVVRGPGAALWGGDAVNGVINIVTRHAVDSLSGAAAAQADDGGSGRVFLRQGFQVGESGALRIYGTGRRRADDAELFGAADKSRSSAWQVGFRYDTEPTDRDAITLQGDFQRGRYSPVVLASLLSTPEEVGHFSGANLLARWTRTEGARHTSLQAYFDETRRRQSTEEPYRRRLFDVELTNQLPLAERHDLVWGLIFRRRINHLTSASIITLQDPADNVFGGYVQDDMALIPERLKLSLGAQLEHSQNTGSEFQPSVRTIWTDPAGWSVWVGVSKAARTPAAREVGVALATRTPTFPGLVFPRSVKPEGLIAYEMGWRGEVTDKVGIDITAYHNEYRNLIAYVLDFSPDGSTFIAQPGNAGKARGHGVEAAVAVRAAPWWSLKLAGSWQNIRTRLESASVVQLTSLGDAYSARHQASVRSSMDLGESVDLDVWLRHVGRLGDGLTPAYTNLDIRLGWRPTPKLEVSVAGYNLLGRHSPQARTDVGAFLLAPTVKPDRRVGLSLSARY